MKNDPQVTKMTQKLEFIATQMIEKPPVKSSTYYSSIKSGRDQDLDLKSGRDQDLDFSGRTSFIDDQPTSLPDADNVDLSTENRELAVVQKKEEEHISESSDDTVPTATVDELFVPALKKEKLSKKFRQWQEDESKLYSDSDWSQKSPRSTSTVSDSPPRQNVDERTDADRNHLPRVNKSEVGSLLIDVGDGQTSEVKEGEPSTLSGDVQEGLDLTGDILQRNLVVTVGNDEYDMFEDPLDTSLKISDVKDDEQDVDLSQIVERNSLDKVVEKPGDFQPFREEERNIDHVEPIIRVATPRRVSRDLSHSLNEAVNVDRKDADLKAAAVEKTPEETADSGDILDSRRSPVVESNVDRGVTEPQEPSVQPYQPQYEEQLQATTRDAEPADGKSPGDVSKTRHSPDVKTAFDREFNEQLERAIRPDQLQYEQLHMMDRDADALQQEVDTTVNSRELETTDEIVVETKVTEVKTVMMHLGESGAISVMETTEVKTDTDMKETKKILERDEVAVSHRKQSDFIPLSPSPSPAGSRSKTPDRHSPFASLAASDSMEKLLEANLAEVRDVVSDTRPGVGVDAGLYVAICLYEPETDDVMSLHDGEFLEVLEDTAEDWWLVKKSFDGREGYVPAHYLRDKQSDDRMVEEEVAKQMDKIYVDSSKEFYQHCCRVIISEFRFKKYAIQSFDFILTFNKHVCVCVSVCVVFFINNLFVAFFLKLLKTCCPSSLYFTCELPQ